MGKKPPLKLVERVINAISDKESIILDSFAGSGTTAHAVLNLNKKKIKAIASLSL